MASWQDDLYEVFVAFASFGAGRAAKAEMDGAHFVKLCKDTGLIDRAFTTTNADLIFAKVKAKGDRKILFEAFLDALALVGEIKFPRDPEGFDRVVLQILHSRGPSSSATAVADASGICEYNSFRFCCFHVVSFALSSLVSSSSRTATRFLFAYLQLAS